jgi:hypothetical protein
VAIDVNGHSSSANTTVNTIDPTDLEAPTVALDLSGIVDGMITGRTDIHGTAVDNNRSANFGTKVFAPTYVLKLAYYRSPWDGQGGAEIDLSNQPAACENLANASLGLSLSKKTNPAAACSRARAGRLDLSRCQSVSAIRSRSARA